MNKYLIYKNKYIKSKKKILLIGGGNIENIKENIKEKLEKCLSNDSNNNNLKAKLDKCLSNNDFINIFNEIDDEFEKNIFFQEEIDEKDELIKTKDEQNKFLRNQNLSLKKDNESCIKEKNKLLSDNNNDEDLCDESC